MTLNNDGCPFPYRCADCNYATKYCHSLKLHLRNYAHKPTMVLNNNGTPNPSSLLIQKFIKFCIPEVKTQTIPTTFEPFSL